MDLIDLVLRTPLVSSTVVLPLLVVGVAQRYLGPRADVVEDVRERWWLRAQELLTLLGGYTTSHSGPNEYVCSVECSADRLERALWQQGIHRNLLAAKKYRNLRGSKQWSDSSWIHRDSLWAERQLHVTLFERPGGGVDCYLHAEASNLTQPLKHWRGVGQVPGDPNGTFADALDAAGVETFRDDDLSA